MTAELWVFAEHYAGIWHEASLEVISEARALADKAGASLTAVVLGGHEHHPLDSLGLWGVDKVYAALDSRLTRYNLDCYCASLVAALRTQPPSAFLAAATPHGHELCATVAARLSTTLVPDCVGVDLAPDGSFLMLRSVYGGAIHARIACSGARFPMITLRPRGGIPAQARTRRQPIVADLALPTEWAPPRMEMIGYLKADPATVDLTEAEIIVAGGRGVGSADGFTSLQALASALNAAVGGTRVAVDEGWLPFARQIGQTGKIVAPRLYIACGISGAIHHTSGIKDSRIIVAINNDRHAPIFKMADVGIVGDLHEIAPALTRAVQRTKAAAPVASAAALLSEAVQSCCGDGGSEG